jgi:GH25 family lysozyme M1 (1,4-beta-N-acetylmuramidase)
MKRKLIADISHWDKGISIPILAEYTDGVYIKISEAMTEDSDYVYFLTQAKQINFPVGVYGFYNPYYTYAAQEKFMYHCMDTEIYDLLPFIDWEECLQNPVENEVYAVASYMDKLEQDYKGEVGLYTSPGFFASYPFVTEKRYPTIFTHPLIVAEWWFDRVRKYLIPDKVPANQITMSDAQPTLPRGFTRWYGWQFTAIGFIPKLSRLIDLSVLNPAYTGK